MLRLLETMQLDVTQKQRHHRPPAQDEAGVVVLRCAFKLTPQRRGDGMGLGVLPEATGPFRGLVVLLEIGVHALGGQSPRCRSLVGVVR